MARDKNLDELLKRLALGETSALGDVYDILAQKIYSYAMVLTRDKQRAEDVTHDVFLEILGKADRILNAANPQGFIMVMTRNRIYNLMRRDKKACFVKEVQGRGEEPKHEERLMLEEAFATLPLNQQEVVFLHLICGHTQKDAAGMLGTPLVTVKWRYSKALAALRKYFEQN